MDGNRRRAREGRRYAVYIGRRGWLLTGAMVVHGEIRQDKTRATVVGAVAVYRWCWRRRSVETIPWIHKYTINHPLVNCALTSPADAHGPSFLPHPTPHTAPSPPHLLHPSDNNPRVDRKSSPPRVRLVYVYVLQYTGHSILFSNFEFYTKKKNHIIILNFGPPENITCNKLSQLQK